VKSFGMRPPASICQPAADAALPALLCKALQAGLLAGEAFRTGFAHNYI